MKWTVLYRASAQDHLANIWLNAPDQQAVANAADKVDRLLAKDPLEAGESRDGNSRVIIEPPLTMMYDVYPDDNLVEVFAVFYWSRSED
jgi:hypothetical protein